MRIGLVGRPKSGKTTLFNLLTGSHAPTARYETHKPDLHMGLARVPDPRLDRLGELFPGRTVVHAGFEVVDLAGFAKGERAGLEAKEFRAADALLHVVRAFGGPALDPPDPRRDIADLETELILADLEVIERRLERLEASLRKRRTDADLAEQAILRGLKPQLEAETPLRAIGIDAGSEKVIRGFTFLSGKPILHCLNLDEKLVGEGARSVERFGLDPWTRRPHTRIGWVSAEIELEVAQLGAEEQQAFLADLGLDEPAIRRVLEDCYALLGLISFFTIGDEEVRAWSIRDGTRAQDAAGTVHTDMARGFIRAEVVRWEDLVAAGGSFAEVRHRGQLKLEGRDYAVRDGEVCYFRFSVGK